MPTRAVLDPLAALAEALSAIHEELEALRQVGEQGLDVQHRILPALERPLAPARSSLSRKDRDHLARLLPAIGGVLGSARLQLRAENSSSTRRQRCGSRWLA